MSGKISLGNIGGLAVRLTVGEGGGGEAAESIASVLESDVLLQAAVLKLVQAAVAEHTQAASVGKVQQEARRAPALWEVAVESGVAVRAGAALTSPKEASRLESRTLVEEVELEGQRLHYRKVSAGRGPVEGWISTCANGRSLVVRAEAIPKTLIIFSHDSGVCSSMTTGLISKVKAILHEEMSSVELCSSGFLKLFVERAPLVFLANIAGYENLKAKHPEDMRRPLAMLGISIEGICAALVASGALCFQKGLELISRLSLIVDEAPWCCLVTVSGLPMEALQWCCCLAKERHGSDTLCELVECLPSCTLVKCSEHLVETFGKLCENKGASVMARLSVQVTGLQEEAVQRCCSLAKEKHGSGIFCRIVDRSVPGQFTVACLGPSVEIFGELFRKEGANVTTNFELFRPTFTSAMDPLMPRIEAVVDEVLPYLKAPQNRVWTAGESMDRSVGQHPQEIAAMLKRCLRKRQNFFRTVEQIIREDQPDALCVAGTSGGVNHILVGIGMQFPYLSKCYRAGGEM